MAPARRSNPVLASEERFWHPFPFLKDQIKIISMKQNSNWIHLQQLLFHTFPRLLINTPHCRQNGPKVSFTESLVAFTDQRWQLLIGGVVSQSASDNYWSAVSVTNQLVTITVPRCHLQIRSVIYQLFTQKVLKPEKILHVHLCTVTQMLATSGKGGTIYWIDEFLSS